MRHWPVALLALAALVAGCGGAKQRPAQLEEEVQDDAQLLYGSTQGVHDAVAQLRSLGVDRIRLTAAWSEIAPAPLSPRRPAFDAGNPSGYPPAGWAPLDRAVAEVIRQGLRPMIDVAFWAPRWAVQRGTGGPGHYRWKPDPVEFGKFAEAVARRYPQVHLWTTWNEPNHSAFLLPQWERRGGRWVAAAAHQYRAMHEQAYAAIKRVSKQNRVLIGGLTSIGTAGRGAFQSIRPLRFVRELACVDSSLRPLRIPECRGFRPLRADGFAHHPYMHMLPPETHLPSPDSVGISDLDRLSSLLQRLHRLGRIESALPLYITEFGYETNPPDPKRGVPLLVQAVWLNHAAAIAYRRPDVRMFSQFLLRDGADNSLYQTGLLLPGGQPKPSLFGYRLPFWIDGLEATGRVRPGAGRRKLRLEVKPPTGAWRPVGRPFDTDSDGIVRRHLPAPGVYRLRWGPQVSLPALAR